MWYISVRHAFFRDDVILVIIDFFGGTGSGVFGFAFASIAVE